MLAGRLVFVAVMLAARLLAEDGIPPEEYRARRAALRAELAGGVTVLFGRTSREAEELRSGFIQEANFLYLTGWREPGAILMLTPPDDEVLFLPAREPEREKYYGRRAAALDDGIGAATGFGRVLDSESFEASLAQALSAHQRVYTLAESAAGEKLRSTLPEQEVVDASAAIGSLRLRKSPREVALIRRSVEASAEAHHEAWRRIRPGVFEYQIAAVIVGAYLASGCERSAYAPIVASGPNATVLHYTSNRRQLRAGDLVLIDAGAECSDYAADLTRTLPVSGKFTPRQRELYEALLGAQRAVLQAVKPGASFGLDAPGSLTRIAREYLDAHGKDAKGRPLGRYLNHLAGHHVGLDVHDAGGLSTSGPLAPGMVVTIEPGIYIEEEGIGIRIEDMVLVTEQGAEVLSHSLPKDPAAIEKALSR